MPSCGQYKGQGRLQNPRDDHGHEGVSGLVDGADPPTGFCCLSSFEQDVCELLAVLKIAFGIGLFSLSQLPESVGNYVDEAKFSVEHEANAENNDEAVRESQAGERKSHQCD